MPGRNSESCPAGTAETPGGCVELSCPPAGSVRPVVLTACATQCGADQRCLASCTCYCAQAKGGLAGSHYDRCMTDPAGACGDGKRAPGRSMAECCKLASMGAVCPAG